MGPWRSPSQGASTRWASAAAFFSSLLAAHLVGRDRRALVVVEAADVLAGAIHALEVVLVIGRGRALGHAVGGLLAPAHAPRRHPVGPAARPRAEAGDA